MSPIRSSARQGLSGDGRWGSVLDEVGGFEGCPGGMAGSVLKGSVSLQGGISWTGEPREVLLEEGGVVLDVGKLSSLFGTFERNQYQQFKNKPGE